MPDIKYLKMIDTPHRLGPPRKTAWEQWRDEYHDPEVEEIARVTLNTPQADAGKAMADLLRRAAALLPEDADILRKTAAEAEAGKEPEFSDYYDGRVGRIAVRLIDAAISTVHKAQTLTHNEWCQAGPTGLFVCACIVVALE